MFKDVDSVEEKLDELMDGQDYSAKKVQSWIKEIPTKLQEYDYEPNNNQLAVAIAIKLQFDRKRKMFVSVPPGKGKSRIIAALATLFMMERKDLSTIHIVFSSMILRDTDKKVFSLLEARLKKTVKIHLPNKE